MTNANAAPAFASAVAANNSPNNNVIVFEAADGATAAIFPAVSISATAAAAQGSASADLVAVSIFVTVARAPGTATANRATVGGQQAAVNSQMLLIF